MDEHKNKTALIAMSGGVDSSVAAYLTQAAGYDCAGATMRLFATEDTALPREGSCCSLDDVEDAKAVARRLGMPHYTFNFSERFRRDVIGRFIAVYESGGTPNPCIDCNRYLKFDQFFLRARELGRNYIVTGHYVRAEKSGERYLLKKALDPAKDQSYVLYALTQEQLAHALFPLGELTKPQVRAIAEEQGFVNAKKGESQDICFVQNESYGDFIERTTGRTYPPGDFVDTEGRVLGRHKGLVRYTVGQRKGLGLALPAPMYVCRIDVEKNQVVLGRGEELFTDTLTAEGLNLIACERLDAPIRVKARVRYRQPEQWATAEQTGPDTLTLRFDEPQRAVTKGQAVVLYDGDVVIGGGTIR